MASSSHNWVYDVFPSFSGEDVRKTFLSHFLKELDRKLIIVFKDNEMERSRSIAPELKQAIRDSRIAVVVISKKYASSSWCLNELLEIMKCKEELGQLVIPVFYGVDPSHVRKQTGDIGEAFEKICQDKAEDEKNQWRQALTNLTNIIGYHSQNWDNQAKLIEEIANDIFGKLNLTPSKDFKDFVGMKDHIAGMDLLLRLESEEVKIVGIWGPSGIGKTSIARILYEQLYHRFQGDSEGRRSSSNLVPTLDSESPKKFKLVRCPSCSKILVEDQDVQCYQCGGCSAILKVRPSSSNLVPTLDSESQKKFNMVRCPTCSKILMEDKDVQLYQCGGCSTILQAKRRNFTANVCQVPKTQRELKQEN